MPTTSQYLEQLQRDKQNLSNKLSEKGIVVTGNETFTELIPKLDRINNDGTALEIVDCYNLFLENHRLEIMNDLLKYCKNVLNTSYMFQKCDKLTTLDLSEFDTSKVTNMSHMFYYCTALTNLDISNFDTSNVTNMDSIFLNCNKLTSLDLSNFNTSNVTHMGYMFQKCNNLATLNISNFDTSNATVMTSMFYDCKSLTDFSFIKKFNTSKVVYMPAMFYGCTNLLELDLSNFNTSNVTNIHELFYNCTNLTKLNLSNLDVSKVEDARNMLTNCTNLTDLLFVKNLGKGYSASASSGYYYYILNLSTCSKLTHDSLMSVINNLYDIKTKGCNPQNLILGSANLAKLTEEEIVIATNKGWVVN